MAKDAINFIYPNPNKLLCDLSGLPYVITSYYQYSENYNYGGWDAIPPSGQVAYPLAGNHAFTVITDREFGHRKVHTLETHHTLNEPMKRFYRITVRYGSTWTFDGKETLGWPLSKYRNVNNFEKIQDFKRDEDAFTIPLEQHNVTDSDYWALVMKISSSRYSTQKSFHSSTVVTYLYLDDLTQIGGVNELVSQSGELTDCIFFDIVRYDATILFLTGQSIWDECRVPAYLSGNPHSSSYGLSGNYPPNGAGSYYQYATNTVDFGTENLRNASYNYSDCILDSGLIINDSLSGLTNIRIPGAMEVQYLNYNGDYELFLSANLTGGNVVLSDSKLYDWMKGTYEIPDDALWVDLFDHEVKPISEISGWPGGRAITEVRLVTGVRGNMVDTPIDENNLPMSGSVGGRQIARMCENIIFPEYHNIARFILDEVPRNSFNIPLHKIYKDLSGNIWDNMPKNEDLNND